MLPGLKTSPQPALKDRDILVHLEATAGTSLPEMTRITQRLSNELRTTSGVGNVGAQVGRAVTSDTTRGVDAAEIWITMKPASPYDATVAAIHRTASGYPGLRATVATYGADQTQQVLTGRDEPVVVRIYGTNYPLLQSKAAEVQSVLARVPGITHPQVVPLVQEPTIEVEVDIAAAQQVGVKPGDVRREATAFVNGIEVGNIFEAQKVFDVVVKGTDATRANLSGIQNILIDTPRGPKVRLGDVAKVRLTSTPSVISHEATKRSVDITANLGDRSLSAVSADIRTRLRQVSMPSEYHAELLSASATRQSGDLRLLEFAVAAAIMLFLLLQAACRSWRLAALIYLLLPVALAGGALALYLDGGVVTLGSYAGALAVLAVASRAAILMIRHFRLLESQEQGAFGADLVRAGSLDRLAPTLMTLLAGGIPLSALVLRGPIAGLEVIRPVAVVVLGGLVTSSLLTLLVLPALYLRFGSAGLAQAPLAADEGNQLAPAGGGHNGTPEAHHAGSTPPAAPLLVNAPPRDLP
ncbi:MAG: hypothetical protein NVSMB32_05920 [Actinomycetota bacterium]